VLKDSGFIALRNKLLEYNANEENRYAYTNVPTILIQGKIVPALN
jgi:hypothetical protein